MHTRGMHRNPDHDTSIAAAESVVEEVTAIQQRVIDLLANAGDFGLTDEQITMALAKPGAESRSTFRTRRTELTSKGIIEWSGVYRMVASRRMSKVWRLAKKEDAAK